MLNVGSREEMGKLKHAPPGGHALACPRPLAGDFFTARHRIARFAACPVAGPLGRAAAHRRGFACRIEIVKTTRRQDTDVPLAKVGTKGSSPGDFEEALLDGRAISPCTA